MTIEGCKCTFLFTFYNDTIMVVPRRIGTLTCGDYSVMTKDSQPCS